MFDNLEFKDAGPLLFDTGAVSVTEFKLVELGDGIEEGTIEGYASIFDIEDQGGDTVERGAFVRSLQDTPATAVKLLWQHDPNEPIGTILELTEDARGLRMRARINPAISKGADVLEMVRSGAVDGLSIGYRTVDSRRNEDDFTRKLIEVELWEVSVVTFPMHRQSRVSGFKQMHRGEDLPTVREFERNLKRDAGFTSEEAKVIVSQGYKALMDERDAVPECDQPATRSILADIRAQMRKA